ncbi:MAG: hypothetical protein U1F51_10090 [Burkholderiales bacterium]
MSRTLMWGTARDWKTMPHSRERTSAAVTSRPASRTAPDCARTNPAIRRSSVVLPQPDGPMQTSISPGAIVRSTSRTPPEVPG